MSIPQLYLLPGLAALLLAGLSVPSQAGTREQATYVELTRYFDSERDLERWYAITDRLRQNFDQICGDSFCEGDYDNIQSLRYVCSAKRSDASIGECRWSFAASDESIDAARGEVKSRIVSWQCRSPLAAATQVGELLTALSGAQPLHAKLPHTQATLYDGLLACL